MEAGMAAATRAITDKLLTARVIASDETTTRTNGIIHWQWVFLSKEAVLHRIAPRRARSVAEEVLGGHQPDVWISNRYAGQQELGKEHQVCLAHVLRDVQYAIDCGDRAFTPVGRSCSICQGIKRAHPPFRETGADDMLHGRGRIISKSECAEGGVGPQHPDLPCAMSRLHR
jgi:hypothetical protein